jgi:hypothetical protein
MSRLGGSIVVALLLLVGCTASYRTDTIGGASTTRLERGRAVLVTIPQDGAYGTRTYGGSGQSVAQAVAAAFSSAAASVHIAERQMTQAESLKSAKSQNVGYVAVPVIAHWEHRNTAWSGLPSRMAIRLTIFDAETGAQLASESIEGRSAIMTPASTSPQSLLRAPLAAYVKSLYGLTP